MWAEAPSLGRVMDLGDPAIHWLIGVRIARRTVENVERAGWVVDRVVPLDAWRVFRRIEAHKP